MSAVKTSAQDTLFILSLVVFSFITFTSTGIPLASLPGYIHHDLGFSTLVAGAVIGVQYLVTLLCRPLAGRLVDEQGARKALLLGMGGTLVSGLSLLMAMLLAYWPLLSLCTMLASRLALGYAQSMIGLSAISWGISKLGSRSTARMISWNGIAAYGGVGIGAPLGVFLSGTLGMWSLGGATVLLAALGLVLAFRRADAPVDAGERLPFGRVLWRVMPTGMSLALGTVGYGTLAAFVALYYNARGWDGAAWCLSSFAFAFIGTRLMAAGLVNRLGGYRIALGCLVVEIVGLLLLWLAESPSGALAGAALTGCGLSLLHPALGVAVVERVGPASRSSGLSAFAMFFDLALGASGMVMGLVVGWVGLRNVFLAAALVAIAGFGVVWALYLQERRQAG